MTTVRRKWWARSKWTLIPLYPPIVAFYVTRLACRSAREVTRSAYKGTKKQIKRAQRQRTNKRADSHDIALRNPMPKVTERNQIESSFFKLPLELRQLIYDEYFMFGKFRLHEHYKQGFELSARIENTRYDWIERILNPRLRFVSKHVLILPLVCRQIYCETIHYIYERNTFNIPSDLALAMPSLKLFPRKHLDSLKSIELKFCFDVLATKMKTSRITSTGYCEQAVKSWLAHAPGSAKERRKWLQMWKLLAELPMLERLRVEFMWLPGPRHLTTEEFSWIMAPLLRFSRPKPLAEFEVVSYSIPEPMSPGWAKAIPYQLKTR